MYIILLNYTIKKIIAYMGKQTLLLTSTTTILTTLFNSFPFEKVINGYMNKLS